MCCVDSSTDTSDPQHHPTPHKHPTTMLSKPGEARSKATPTQRRRKVVEENLDDVVRRLQRLPHNKACADCQSKVR